MNPVDFPAIARVQEKRARLQTLLATRTAHRARQSVSYAQRRLWFLDQLEPGDSTYNVHYAVRLLGPLDPHAMRRTFSEILRRHHALRSTFVVDKEEPALRLRPAGPFALPLTDFSALDSTARERLARHAIERQVREPFDLAMGPLVRAALIRLDAREHVLVVTMHHIVFFSANSRRSIQHSSAGTRRRSRSCRFSMRITRSGNASTYAARSSIAS